MKARQRSGGKCPAVKVLTHVERDTQVPAHSMNFCITGLPSNNRLQGERRWQQSCRLSEGSSWQAGLSGLIQSHPDWRGLLLPPMPPGPLCTQNRALFADYKGAHWGPARSGEGTPRGFCLLIPLTFEMSPSWSLIPLTLQTTPSWPANPFKVTNGPCRSENG